MSRPDRDGVSSPPVFAWSLMFRRSVRTKYTLPVIVTVVLLRLVIGLHFYHEGRTKLDSGTFTSAGFLGNAKGPLAPFFHSFVADRDWRARFGYIGEADRQTAFESPIDMKPTLEQWKAFRAAVIQHDRLGDEGEVGRAKQELERAEQDLADARKAGDFAESTRLEARVRGLTVAVASGGDQIKRADAILESYGRQLADLYEVAGPDLRKYFYQLDHVVKRRGEAEWQDLSDRRGQIDYAEKTAQADVRKWVKDIDALWDGFEQEMTSIATPTQRERYGPIHLRRPGDVGLVSSRTVDKIIPWFDTILGLLIFFGLFTRLAATAAGLFLLSVCLSQWPGSPGATDVSYQAVECAACFVLAAIGAGRFAGLDFFLRAAWYAVFPPRLEPSVPADAPHRRA